MSDFKETYIKLIPKSCPKQTWESHISTGACECILRAMNPEEKNQVICNCKNQIGERK